MNSHTLARALDDFLVLMQPDHAARREIETYLQIPSFPDMPPAFSALARLRWEAEREVERLLALIDAIDGDPDLEPENEDGGDETLPGFEPNLASTPAEDGRGVYAGGHIGLWYASQIDECEEVSEDEGSACEHEGSFDDREPDVDAEITGHTAGGQGV